MSKIRFAWDEHKNKENQDKHGVSFEEAQTVFFDDTASNGLVNVVGEAMGHIGLSARLVPAMARKWKQINKFVEILAHALASAGLARRGSGLGRVLELRDRAGDRRAVGVVVAAQQPQRQPRLSAALDWQCQASWGCLRVEAALPPTRVYGRRMDSGASRKS